MSNSISLSVHRKESGLVLAPLDPCNSIEEWEEDNIDAFVILAEIAELAQRLSILGPVGSDFGRQLWIRLRRDGHTSSED